MALLHETVFEKNFSIEKIDISDINDMVNHLPRNGVVDINIAERCLLVTLEAQNMCQEKVVQVDRLISYLESKKNKAWSEAALTKAKVAGHKTAKDKEWFAQSDDDYIEACNDLALAKASKKWLENKANYFSGWHYALKTFLRRDYGIEMSSNIGYNSVDAGSGELPFRGKDDDIVINDDDVPWE